MPGQQGDVDLGNDRVVVADDAGEQLLAGAEHAQEVVADLLLDRPGRPAAVAEFLERGRTDGVGHDGSSPLNRIAGAGLL